MRSLAFFAVLLLFLFLLAACQSKPAVAAGDPAAGQQVFQSACAVCHTTTNEKKVGPGLAGFYRKQTLPDGQPVNDESVKSWIRNGGGTMPGFKNALSAEQINNLVAYLKTL